MRTKAIKKNEIPGKTISKRDRQIYEILKGFSYSYDECIEVIDDENAYANGNNLRRAIQYFIALHGFGMDVTIRGDRVFVIKK